MSNFVEIEQDGKKAFVNADSLVLVLPSTLINQTDLLLSNGLKLTVKDSPREFVDKSEGKSPQIF